MSEKQWHRKRKREREEAALKKWLDVYGGWSPYPRRGSLRVWAKVLWDRIKGAITRRFCRHEDVGFLTPPGWGVMRKEYHVCRKCGKVLAVRHFVREGRPG